MDFPKIQDESSFREFRTHLSQSFKGARSLGFSREMSFYNKNYVYVIYDNYIEENSRIADKMDEDEIVPRYGEPKDDRGIVVYKRGIKKNVKVTDLKCNSNYFSLYRNNDKNEGMP